MKKIVTFAFNELSKEAQLAVIKKHRNRITNDALVYLNEVYAEHVDTLAETGLFVKPLYVCSYAPWQIAFDSSVYREEDYNTFGVAVVEKLRTAIENSWFVDELSELLEEYEEAGCEAPVPLLAMHFIYTLNQKAYKWFIRFSRDDEYTLAYILGNVATDYISRETIFDGYEFLEDGTDVNID